MPERTGVFFDRQGVECLIAAVEQMELFLPHFDPRDAVAKANRFAPEIFDQRISRLIADI